MFNFNLPIKKQQAQENNRIILSIDNNNKISIELEMLPNFDNIGKTMGQLLYSINSGALENSFADMLVEYAEKNPDYKNIIEQIILTWISYKNKKDNEPYISPTKVFSQ